LAIMAGGRIEDIEQLRQRLHDCNEYALRLQYKLERCRDCS
jgi:hypothetical protein